MIIIFFFWPFLCLKRSVSPRHLWFIVHGTQLTRTIKQPWWKKESPFYIAFLNALPYKNELYSYEWCGTLSEIRRKNAGKKLAEEILRKTDKNCIISIVGHSYGGEVGLYAAQILSKKEDSPKIKQIFTLGTPIKHDSSTPRTSEVGSIYNCYSFGDFFQPIGGTRSRVFPEGENIYNIEVTINGISPDHYQIRHIIIAKHLPLFSQIIKKNKGHIVHLFSDRKPSVTLDPEYHQKIKNDNKFHKQLPRCAYETSKEIHEATTEYIREKQDWILRLWRRRLIDSEKMPKFKS